MRPVYDNPCLRVLALLMVLYASIWTCFWRDHSLTGWVRICISLCSLCRLCSAGLRLSFVTPTSSKDLYRQGWGRCRLSYHLDTQVPASYASFCVYLFLDCAASSLVDVFILEPAYPLVHFIVLAPCTCSSLGLGLPGGSPLMLTYACAECVSCS